MVHYLCHADNVYIRGYGVGDAKMAGTSRRKKLVNEVVAGFQRSSGQGVVLSQLIADKSGVSPTDLETLGFLEQEGPVTAGRLAELSGLTTGAVTRLIDRLEAAKYVRRRDDPADRRRVVVELNRARLKEFAPFYDPMREDSTKILERYSEKELELIARLLRDMNDFGLRHADRIRALPDLPRRKRLKLERKIMGQKVRLEL
jgi:DNA-binding MarR family transcriptional regulator